MASPQTSKPRSSMRKALPAVAAAKPVTAPKAKKISVKSSKPSVGSQEWQEMVATAAYFRAQAREFIGGSAEQDWIEAEAEVAGRFVKGSAKHT